MFTYFIDNIHIIWQENNKSQLTYLGIIIFALAMPISNSGMEIGKALILLFCIIDNVFLHKKSNPISKTFLFISSGLILTNAISTLVNINSMNYEVALSRFYHNTSRVLLCLAIMSIKLDKKQIIFLLKLICIGVLVETGYIIYDFFTNPLIDHPQFRVGGLLGCVNNAGQMYSISFPVIFIMIYYFYKDLKWQIFFALTSFFTAIGTIMTGSRLPMAVVGFHIFFITILSIQKKLILKLSLVGIAVLIGIGSYFMFPRIQKGFSSTVLTLDFGARIPIWETSFKAGLNQPVFGIGPGLLVSEFRKNDIPRHFHAHNNFLNEFAVVGLAGLLFVILFHIYIGYYFWKKRKRIFDSTNLLPLGLFGTFISFFILGTLDYTLYGVVAGHCMWFFLGLTMSYLNSEVEIKS